MSQHSLISVVDDDPSVRESLPDLLREFGYAVEVFASAELFLQSDCLVTTGCLILDVAMPGMTGPDLHHELLRRGYSIPVIFITAHGDAKDCPKLNRLGVVGFLIKPFSEVALLKALHSVFVQ
ncbi:MAG: response regulator [Devosia sp.]